MIEHDYATEWSHNGNNHWHECSVCHDKTDVGEHDYEHAFDSDCNTCGLKRKVTAVLGDVNRDGELNNIDAAWVLKYDVGNIEFDDYQLIAADVNGDGEVNNIDAAQMLKYDVGIIEEF